MGENDHPKSLASCLRDAKAFLHCVEFVTCPSGGDDRFPLDTGRAGRNFNRPMRLQLILLSAILGIGLGSVAAAGNLPVVSTADAAKHIGKMALLHGRVTAITWVAGGPLIFDLDGKPFAPAARCLVYPMAAPRFGTEPQKTYLGKMVEVQGLIVQGRNQPNAWISDPAHIKVLAPAGPGGN
jgi:hypothetical protein